MPIDWGWQVNVNCENGTVFALIRLPLSGDLAELCRLLAASNALCIYWELNYPPLQIMATNAMTVAGFTKGILPGLVPFIGML
ncbi:MAG: hypothetical protein COA36_14150 [Desulfotalea sp.]|nr:MAG: hypothetical protein COA36_14150 [Desulfotalea sp.]